MRDKNKCKICECYNCDKNDQCLECQSCIDNDLFVDILETQCQDREEVEYPREEMKYPIEPLPCPFCGTELKEYPMVMIVEPVRSEEYLMAKLNKGHFLGTDNWFHVHCIRCGSTGARGLDRVAALERWNERGHSSMAEKLGWK